MTVLRSQFISEIFLRSVKKKDVGSGFFGFFVLFFISNFFISNLTLCIMENKALKDNITKGEASKDMAKDVQRNVLIINNKIEQACKLYEKDKSKINLIAVSKTQTSENIYQAINAGCKIFGENYIKECKEKWPEIKSKYPEVALHFIGHLQSNKAGDAVDLFDCIQTLDSKKLAIALKKEIDKRNKNIEIFIQVNISEEPQKGGILPQDLKEFVEFSRDECGLNITGLMCIPTGDELASPYFALLNKLADENNVKKLSMGMSADFEQAIALNADYIRVGTAIFGKREL